MVDSITVSASAVYGHPDPTSLKKVAEHWATDQSCDVHSLGHPPYLNRTALEKYELHDIAFRYREMREVALIKFTSDCKWTINGKFLCDFGPAGWVVEGSKSGPTGPLVDRVDKLRKEVQE